MKRETFDNIINAKKVTDETFDKFSELKIDLFELDMFTAIWEAQDNLMQELLKEVQCDYLNWWLHENNMGNGLFNSGDPAVYKIDGEHIYTGKDLDKVYETLISIKK